MKNEYEKEPCDCGIHQVCAKCSPQLFTTNTPAQTTPTNQPSETDNFCSSKHPHEPAIKSQLDADGRCLICGLLCQIDQLSQQLATAIAERDAWLTKHDKLMDKVEAVLEHNHKVETHNQSLTLERDKAIAERDKNGWDRTLISSERDKLQAHNQSLTTLCAKLDNALRCANNCYCGDPYGQKVIDEALAHYAELLKKKE